MEWDDWEMDDLKKQHSEFLFLSFLYGEKRAREMIFLPPQPQEEEPGPSPEYLKVVGWRRDYLVRAGYDEEAAALIAGTSVDLHFAGDLLGRGCPATTALLILL